MNIKEIANANPIGNREQQRQPVKLKLKLGTEFAEMMRTVKISEEEAAKATIRADGVISLEGTNIGYIQERAGYIRRLEQDYHKYG